MHVMAKRKLSDLDRPDIDGEPEGWRELQELARNEKDPKKLEGIIAQMNQLLTECEKQAFAKNGPHTSRRARPKKNG